MSEEVPVASAHEPVADGREPFGTAFKRRWANTPITRLNRFIGALFVGPLFIVLHVFMWRENGNGLYLALVLPLLVLPMLVVWAWTRVSTPGILGAIVLGLAAGPLPYVLGL
ncbi:hypothetical protein [Nocardioides abyssi]|uniref:Uncharacterized protein n=1 Tax=Nocardioides abyssi TaxID=3058370 RepID=A0ABT8EXJ9_9ACTN|nr:hypothetical protein [Nocardioides abyssi]MDN4162857.1 hypothetical protein [Nocardioides abyssi]